MRGTKNEAGGTVIGQLPSGIQVSWYEGSAMSFEESCKRFDATQAKRAAKDDKKESKLSALPNWLTHEVADRAMLGDYELTVTATTISGPVEALREIPAILLDSIDMLANDHNGSPDLAENTLKIQIRARKTWAARIAQIMMPAEDKRR